MNRALLLGGATVLIVLAAGGALWKRGSLPSWGASGAPGPSGTGAGAPSQARLESEIAALRRENAALRARLGEAPSSAAGPAALAPGALPGAAAESPEVLLARAREAALAGDVQAYTDAFLALLDAGEAGQAAALALIEEGSQERLTRKMRWDNPAAMRAWALLNGGLAERAPRLGSLLDRVLSQEPLPEKSGGWAFGLLRMGAQSSLPKERRLALALRWLDSEEDQPRWFAVSMLRSLDAAEALPLLEERLKRATGQNSRHALVQAITSFQGPEGRAALVRLLEDPELKPYTRNALHNLQGEGAEDFLWGLLRDGKVERALVLDALAARPGQVERVLDLITDPASSQADREVLRSGIWIALTQDDDVRSALWRRIDRDPALEDTLLPTLLQSGRKDERAQARLLERLDQGRLDSGLIQILQNLPEARLREHAGALKALISDTSRPLEDRGPAFWALGKADPQGALDALSASLPSMSAPDRLQSLQWLPGMSHAGSRVLLERLAAQDPDAEVRKAAASALSSHGGIEEGLIRD